MYNNKYSGGALAWVGCLGAFAIIGGIATGVNNMERSSITTQTEVIPYNTTYVEDAELEYGKMVTRSQGVSGSRTLTYKVTTKAGKQVSRELVGSEVTSQPKDKVVARGTKPAWHCHDTTSFNQNPYDDNYCEYSDGTGRYVADSEAQTLDPEYKPGKSGAAYYNNF